MPRASRSARVPDPDHLPLHHHEDAEADRGHHHVGLRMPARRTRAEALDQARSAALERLDHEGPARGESLGVADRNAPEAARPWSMSRAAPSHRRSSLPTPRPGLHRAPYRIEDQRPVRLEPTTANPPPGWVGMMSPTARRLPLVRRSRSALAPRMSSWSMLYQPPCRSPSGPATARSGRRGSFDGDPAGLGRDGLRRPGRRPAAPGRPRRGRCPRSPANDGHGGDASPAAGAIPAPARMKRFSMRHLRDRAAPDRARPEALVRDRRPASGEAGGQRPIRPSSRGAGRRVGR